MGYSASAVWGRYMYLSISEMRKWEPALCPLQERERERERARESQSQLWVVKSITLTKGFTGSPYINNTIMARILRRRNTFGRLARRPKRVDKLKLGLILQPLLVMCGQGGRYSHQH